MNASQRAMHGASPSPFAIVAYLYPTVKPYVRPNAISSVVAADLRDHDGDKD